MDDEHCERLFDWLNPQEPAFKGKGDLSEVLYFMSENGMWPDDAGDVSQEQAVLCWAVVEKLRRTKLPEKFKL